jgi:Leucine-rich repeat (LRR) protein
MMDGWMDETVDYDSHCQWYGISCVDGFVTSIDLRGNNLVGQFPVYTRNNEYDGGNPILDNSWMLSKYGVANLYKLKTLDLANNKLNGTIEYAPLYNLNALTHFDVSGNNLSGEVDALVARSLTYADFSNNNFTSMRRFQKYKVSPLQTLRLRYCDVSNNAIQEDATDLLENIPPNIEQFIASNNQINGSLPDSLNNLQKLRQFNMSFNALSGKLPGFTESFVTLQELDMSNQTNSFTGSIPENVWRSLSLKKLNLAGNRLTGTIPSLVGNLAVMEVFDLSNNFLESSLPVELGKLEGE